jgi:putative transposase
MIRGLVYLVAIMDWLSRYVLSWELSISLEKEFCLMALDKALNHAQPEIFNTDQGSQFSSTEFTGRLEQSEVSISMDGRGHVFDNIFIERLWRTVKYEEVYLHDYGTVREARDSLADYLKFYNTERFHTSLGNRTPYEIYPGEQNAHEPWRGSAPGSPYSTSISVQKTGGKPIFRRYLNKLTHFLASLTWTVVKYLKKVLDRQYIFKVFCFIF